MRIGMYVKASVKKIFNNDFGFMLLIIGIFSLPVVLFMKILEYMIL